MVKVNGKEEKAEGKTIAQYLSDAEYDMERTAVEKNGDIVKKDMYASVTLDDGDIVEIVSFTGGG